MDDCKHPSLTVDANGCIRLVLEGRCSEAELEKELNVPVMDWICLGGHPNCATPNECAGRNSNELFISIRDLEGLRRAAQKFLKHSVEQQVDLRTFEEDYRPRYVADDSDTLARCVATLLAAPFSMRENRAVEVARAVLKTALDR